MVYFTGMMGKNDTHSFAYHFHNLNTLHFYLQWKRFQLGDNLAIPMPWYRLFDHPTLK